MTLFLLVEATVSTQQLIYLVSRNGVKKMYIEKYLIYKEIILPFIS
jgi:hypothetical protein